MIKETIDRELLIEKDMGHLEQIYFSALELC